MRSPSFWLGWYDWIRAPEQNFLRWGIALSMLVHALILAWPESPERPHSDASALSLDVVIVNTFDEQEPLTPNVIAQANLEGGGDQSERIASTPSPRVGDVEEDISLEAMTQQRQSLE